MGERYKLPPVCLDSPPAKRYLVHIGLRKWKVLVMRAILRAYLWQLFDFVRLWLQTSFSPWDSEYSVCVIKYVSGVWTPLILTLNWLQKCSVNTCAVECITEQTTVLRCMLLFFCWLSAPLRVTTVTQTFKHHLTTSCLCKPISLICTVSCFSCCFARVL